MPVITVWISSEGAIENPTWTKLDSYNDLNMGDSATVGVLEESFRIDSIIGATVDTCDITIFDKLGRNSELVIPTMGDIRVTVPVASDGSVSMDAKNDPDHSDWRTIFGGLIAYVEGTVEGYSRYWDLSCQDYTILLDRTLVRQSYQTGYTYPTGSDPYTFPRKDRTLPDGSRIGLMGDQAIIASAFDNDVIGRSGSQSRSEIIVDVGADSNELNPPVTLGLDSLAQQDFRFSTLREVVSQLAQYVGYDFYVDYNKYLHYYYREDNNTDLVLTDSIQNSDDDMNYRNLTWKKDGTRVVNTFALFGDRLLADNVSFIIETDGVNTEYDVGIANPTIRLNFPLVPEPGRETIRVDLNANANLPLTSNVHDGGDNSATFESSSGDFISDGVSLGEMIINQNTGARGVISNYTTTEIVAPLEFGSRSLWNNGDIAIIPTWTPLAVSSDTLRETFSEDVRHDAIGATLEFNTPPPDSDYSVRIRCTYNFVAGHLETDEGSVSRYSDRVLSRRVVASDVSSAQGMLQKMRHLREQYADALEVATMKITDDMYPDPDPNNRRLESGQWVRFINTILGVDKEMLIHRISTRILGTTPTPSGASDGESFLEYELELRDWEQDLI